MFEQYRHINYPAKGATRRRLASRAFSQPLHSPAKRRDSQQPRVINSREVRFSDGNKGVPTDQFGYALNSPDALIPDTTEQSAQRSLCDDMTLNLKARSERKRLRERRRRQAIVAAIVICLAAVFCGGLFWMQRSTDLARALTQQQDAQQRAHAGLASVAATSSAGTAGLPTPIVASFQGVAIHLSVRVSDLTEVAFHPASNPYAMVLDTTLTPDNAETVRATKSTGRDKSKQSEGGNSALIGSYIQMWRTGTGGIPGLTSIDEGAPAGSVTYAPINGTVTALREYNYENGCKDYEVHLSFESTALARYELVMIHEENVKVKVGDKVIGGVTPIAQVRDLTPFLDNQLGEYTGEAGNHAHVQVNDKQAPSYAIRMQYREDHGYYLN